MVLRHERMTGIDGLQELDHALSELPKATSRNVLKRVLKKRAQPIVDSAKAKVRVDEGDLKDSIGTGSKLTRRQGSLHRKQVGRAGVEMFIGAGGLPQAITEEFGTIDQPPHPFLRPAWDAGKGPFLEGLKSDLWTEIAAAAKRLARRAARLAAKG